MNWLLQLPSTSLGLRHPEIATGRSASAMCARRGAPARGCKSEVSTLAPLLGSEEQVHRSNPGRMELAPKAEIALTQIALHEKVMALGGSIWPLLRMELL